MHLEHKYTFIHESITQIGLNCETMAGHNCTRYLTYLQYPNHNIETEEWVRLNNDSHCIVLDWKAAVVWVLIVLAQNLSLFFGSSSNCSFVCNIFVSCCCELLVHGLCFLFMFFSFNKSWSLSKTSKTGSFTFHISPPTLINNVTYTSSRKNDTYAPSNTKATKTLLDNIRNNWIWSGQCYGNIERTELRKDIIENILETSRKLLMINTSEDGTHLWRFPWEWCNLPVA